MGNFKVKPPKETFPQAKSAAMRALELDGTVALAHVALAWVKMAYERDWPGAERAFLRARELNPGESYVGYAFWLQAMGRLGDAIAEAKHVRDLDPLTLESNNAVGRMLYLDRRYDQAIREFLKTLELDPNNSQALAWLASAYLQKGMPEEALQQRRRWLELKGGGRTGPLAHAYALVGRRAEAQKLLHELVQRSGEELLHPANVALVYAALGEKDEAFAWLDKAYDAYDSHLFQLRDPQWDPLRDDQRFSELLRRLNLPEEAYSALELPARKEPVS
jgi:tetratricopeptide (TPR) repeat protein